MRCASSSVQIQQSRLFSSGEHSKEAGKGSPMEPDAQELEWMEKFATWEDAWKGLAMVGVGGDC